MFENIVTQYYNTKKVTSRVASCFRVACCTCCYVASFVSGVACYVLGVACCKLQYVSGTASCVLRVILFFILFLYIDQIIPQQIADT